MADGGKALGAKGDAAIIAIVRRKNAANNSYIYRIYILAKCQNIFTNTTTGQILPGGIMI